MKVREEIQQLSKPEDQPILEWLFNHYHWASQWSFVATFTHLRYGTESYKVHRVWAPTKEGRAIYSMLSGVKCPECDGRGEVETGIPMPADRGQVRPPLDMERTTPGEPGADRGRPQAGRQRQHGDRGEPPVRCSQELRGGQEVSDPQGGRRPSSNLEDRMTTFSIKDYGLTAEQLDDKYSPEGDGQHPEYTRADWRAAVWSMDTISGYWEWVRHQLVMEEEELDRDNPYNAYWADS